MDISFRELQKRDVINIPDGKCLLYNDQMLCEAAGIDVVVHKDHADCETYEPRQS